MSNTLGGLGLSSPSEDSSVGQGETVGTNGTPLRDFDYFYNLQGNLNGTNVENLGPVQSSPDVDATILNDDPLAPTTFLGLTTPALDALSGTTATVISSSCLKRPIVDTSAGSPTGTVLTIVDGVSRTKGVTPLPSGNVSYMGSLNPTPRNLSFSQQVNMTNQNALSQSPGLAASQAAKVGQSEPFFVAPPSKNRRSPPSKNRRLSRSMQAFSERWDQVCEEEEMQWRESVESQGRLTSRTDRSLEGPNYLIQKGLSSDFSKITCHAGGSKTTTAGSKTTTARDSKTSGREESTREQYDEASSRDQLDQLPDEIAEQIYFACLRAEETPVIRRGVVEHTVSGNMEHTLDELDFPGRHQPQLFAALDTPLDNEKEVEDLSWRPTTFRAGSSAEELRASHSELMHSLVSGLSAACSSRTLAGLLVFRAWKGVTRVNPKKPAYGSLVVPERAAASVTTPTTPTVPLPLALALHERWARSLEIDVGNTRASMVEARKSLKREREAELKSFRRSLDYEANASSGVGFVPPKVVQRAEREKMELSKDDPSESLTAFLHSDEKGARVTQELLQRNLVPVEENGEFTTFSSSYEARETATFRSAMSEEHSFAASSPLDSASLSLNRPSRYAAPPRLKSGVELLLESRKQPIPSRAKTPRTPTEAMLARLSASAKTLNPKPPRLPQNKAKSSFPPPNTGSAYKPFSPCTTAGTPLYLGPGTHLASSPSDAETPETTFGRSGLGLLTEPRASRFRASEIDAAALKENMQDSPAGEASEEVMQDLKEEKTQATRKVDIPEDPMLAKLERMAAREGRRRMHSTVFSTWRDGVRKGRDARMLRLHKSLEGWNRFLNAQNLELQQQLRENDF